MPKYSKILRPSYTRFFCIDENELMVVDIPEYEWSEFSPTILIIDLKHSNRFIYDDAIVIKETEYLNAVGNIQAKIQNFINKIRNNQ